MAIVAFTPSPPPEKGEGLSGCRFQVICVNFTTRLIRLPAPSPFQGEGWDGGADLEVASVEVQEGIRWFFKVSL